MPKIVHPYNFVSAPKKKAVFQERNEDELTGYIEYTITTQTPIFIPNSSADHAFQPVMQNGNPQPSEHKSYDFYSYNILKDQENDNTPQTPVIPGSELRGMFRNIYEVLTNSCFSAINDERILSKRHSDPAKPGLIVRTSNGSGGYDFSLKTAEVAVYPYDDANKKGWLKGIKDTSAVKIDYTSIPDPGNPALTINKITSSDLFRGMTDGVLKIGEKPVRGNRNIHVFMNSGGVVTTISEAHLEGLSKSLELYGDPSVNQKIRTGHSGYKDYKDAFNIFKNGGKGPDIFPVYYAELKLAGGTTLYYLSPAAISKEVYYNKVSDITKKQGIGPCVTKIDLCPACTLFGFVGNDGEAHASSVRFRDAFLEKSFVDQPVSDLYEAVTTLKELASPKASSTEFYLKKPKNADYWTYDYYVQGGGFYEYTPELAGRKVYLHDLRAKNNPEIYSDPKGERTKRNVTVRPLKAGVQFVSRVYFDRISETQLKQLIRIVNLGAKEKVRNDGYKYGYKLGMGKPIGLGSITTEVTEVRTRKFGPNLEEGYQLAPYTDWEGENLFVSEKETEFLKFAELTARGNLSIEYPTAADGEIYTWFLLNRTDGRITKRKDTQIKQVINSGNLQLEIGQKRPQKQGGNQGGHNRGNLGGRGGSPGRGGMAGGRPAAPALAPEIENPPYAVNDILSGTVTGYNEKGTGAHITLEDGNKATVYFNRDQRLKAKLVSGANVKVKYKGREPGRDGKYHLKWSFVE